jgi:lipopolysaccharide/colanic/teichoic acid biosynthesis glycosyltransferase/nucleoside-diphosphate-sugar epimerase
MDSTFYSQIGKRWLDAILSLAALILVSPLLLLAALAIRLTSRGPILFRQSRVGRHGKLFRIFKLRTMIDLDSAKGSSITSAGDPRITPIGRWLRKTKIDELPQLLNVLRGEMSLVGPRPDVPEYRPAQTQDSLAACAEPSGIILRARPGITGPAAIAYFHEEHLLEGQPDKENFYRRIILPHKIALDSAYCKNVRFLEDLKLILKTAAKLFDPRKQSPAAPFGNRPQPAPPDELLGRESVELTNLDGAVSSTYNGKRILVTGAGGSIGSELVRQLIRLGPSRIACLDKDENSIYELEQELLLRGSPVNADSQIADIRDICRLRSIFSEFRPQIIFHAAAHKHVPLMEKHPSEAVLNNVGGTRNVLEAANEFGAERFVFISSDKAVNPASVMGATKRIGEILVQNFPHDRRFRSACVRFGNVLGSRGSVLPLFKKQIARGGPVTVTDPHAERYFMTIEEAVELILRAGTLAHRGEIFVFDMGRPRNILSLARSMIFLSGFEPEKDIETTFTGLRPGEKLSEELAGNSETLRRTRFKKLSAIEPQPIDAMAFMKNLARLEQAAAKNDRHEIYEIFGGMDLGFKERAAKARTTTAAD